MNSSLMLVTELEEFLAENRRDLSEDEIKLINRVIEQLKSMDDPADTNYYDALQSIVNVIELVMKVMDINQ